MAKKARKRLVTKARKPARSARKSAKKRKHAAAKPRRKAAPAKKAKPIAERLAAGKPVAGKPVAGNPAAAEPVATQPVAAQQPVPKRESFLRKVEGAVEAVFDTLTDAERLHRKLEPDITPDQE
jgi:hypothetical protein